MPLGWERINAKCSAPNKNIVFIKPRPGPDESISKDFLERIAAQCLPIMNKHALVVVSLEEYEPNLEFWGRNFNTGEVIQLVLKSPSTGRWLPFRFVQMVMMHELAHNKQMNHSKAFWAVRNELSAEMQGLWMKGYTGDGLWGRGVLLENGVFSHDKLGEGDVLPEHMCGGGFVSRRGQKRKIKPKIPSKETKEKMIRKKFGVNGMALGADEEIKVKLENGKRPTGKPRVAGSKRGRELRAAAALARFEPLEKEPEMKEKLVTDSEAESETEDDCYIKTEPDDAVDIDGQRLLDSDGRGLVKVCEDEDKDDEDAKKEMLDLQATKFPPYRPKSPAIKSYGTWSFSKAVEPTPAKDAEISKQPDTTTSPFIVTQIAKHTESRKAVDLATAKPIQESIPIREDTSTASEAQYDDDVIFIPTEACVPTSKVEATARSLTEENSHKAMKSKGTAPTLNEHACKVCSVDNEAKALTCIVCSNVLHPDFVPNTWRCRSATCKDSVYLNSGDVIICGVCGSRRSEQVVQDIWCFGMTPRHEL
ncbi:WLM domain-containing protein [Calycina marina]|uniref:WLM domain-containing protein n=1 Tax=Calycina marina TaxID=1763456 RepID=A0A9P7ZBR1_9HELO|nr:WLM domain-containing protein [Calycina marina]